ncbi:hypothetical protein EDC01DRAFT_628881 [Geopyxis carbonaria]|nr:hypothetical protein EDC01DRAFT_628881 [Geopyxis carbonaria]
MSKPPASATVRPTLENLPMDMLFMILPHLRSLKSLSRTSRALNRACKPRLFSYFHPQRSEWYISLLKTLQTPKAVSIKAENIRHFHEDTCDVHIPAESERELISSTAAKLGVDLPDIAFSADIHGYANPNDMCERAPPVATLALLLVLHSLPKLESLSFSTPPSATADALIRLVAARPELRPKAFDKITWLGLGTREAGGYQESPDVYDPVHAVLPYLSPGLLPNLRYLRLDHMTDMLRHYNPELRVRETSRETGGDLLVPIMLQSPYSHACREGDEDIFDEFCREELAQDEGPEDAARIHPHIQPFTLAHPPTPGSLPLTHLCLNRCSLSEITLALLLSLPSGLLSFSGYLHGPGLNFIDTLLAPHHATLLTLAMENCDPWNIATLYRTTTKLDCFTALKSLNWHEDKPRFNIILPRSLESLSMKARDFGEDGAREYACFVDECVREYAFVAKLHQLLRATPLKHLFLNCCFEGYGGPNQYPRMREAALQYGTCIELFTQLFPQIEWVDEGEDEEWEWFRRAVDEPEMARLIKAQTTPAWDPDEKSPTAPGLWVDGKEWCGDE